MGQDPFVNSSKSFHQNIKDFFKKFFIFLKKSCQVFLLLFLQKNKKKNTDKKMNPAKHQMLTGFIIT